MAITSCAVQYIPVAYASLIIFKQWLLDYWQKVMFSCIKHPKLFDLQRVLDKITTPPPTPDSVWTLAVSMTSNADITSSSPWHHRTYYLLGKKDIDT